MESAYEAKKYEKEIYETWQKSGFFNPDRLPPRRLTQLKTRISTDRFCIVIPPPNVTGSLHMGHALNNTIQDILTRFYRMNGYQALWLPGTDHAGIATQNVVEKELKKEGLNRKILGREKFVERVWQWVEKYGHLIIEQLKKLGCSCDWNRQRFTLDKEYSQAVYSAFFHYYKKGLIYRGPRIVNWCPRCETAISDIEVKYQQQKGKLWYIRYPLMSRINADDTRNYAENSPRQSASSQRQSAFIVVATTRPETMLGDTAVAVNPKDERYKNLIGQTLILPLMNREIPIIAHHLVDPEFGTGAVKITPAHDVTDWKIGKEKKLAAINVIGPDGKMTKEAGKFAGLTALEAREKILEELKNQNLLEKVEDYIHNLALCDRCSTPIEPQISRQWFLKMRELAKPAVGVVKNGKIKIIPKRYEKMYLNWLTKAEDWCISRQLYWGHSIPIWYCYKCHNDPEKYKNGEYWWLPEKGTPKKCPRCGSNKIHQDTDVLDTWFSAALWPFAVLGFPKKTSDLKKFYPTDFLSTAQEILYLWVARMVFSSLEFTGKIPFKNVYIHPTVLAITGKRMSKSLGTGIDPLEIGEKYGFDSVRMGLIYQMNRNQQTFKFDERAILASRNFINKLWNISRFTQMQNLNLKSQNCNFKSKIKSITLADRWILSRLNFVIESVTKKIKTYQLGEAVRELYDFTWHELADWYIEISKFQISLPTASQFGGSASGGKLLNSTTLILHNSLFIILKLLHPFIPFVTEAIYQQTTNNRRQTTKLLMVEDWPKVDKKLIDKKAEKDFEKIKNLVVEIRNWKQAEKITFKEIRNYQIKKAEKIFSEYQEMIEKLAKVKLEFS